MLISNEKLITVVVAVVLNALMFYICNGRGDYANALLYYEKGITSQVCVH